jgi:hypothetical protein
MGARGVEVLPLVYDLVVWYARQVPQYPKAFKYTLGERILDTLLDVLERLVEAQYSGKGQKGGSLRRANLSLEKLRYLFRLSKDLQCLSLREYEFAARAVVEIGRRIGGWQRHNETLLEEKTSDGEALQTSP